MVVLWFENKLPARLETFKLMLGCFSFKLLPEDDELSQEAHDVQLLLNPAHALVKYTLLP